MNIADNQITEILKDLKTSEDKLEKSESIMKLVSPCLVGRDWGPAFDTALELLISAREDCYKVIEKVSALQ